MTSRAKIIRKAFALVGATAVTGLAAPAALADPPQGHRPTAPDAAAPDLAERIYLKWRLTNVGAVTDHTARFVGRDQPDGYQPGLRTASSARSASTSESFAWEDAGVGALAGFAFALLTGGALVSRRMRGRLAHS